MKTIMLSALLVLVSAIPMNLFGIAEIRFGAYNPATSTFDVLLLNAPTAAAFSFDIDGATVSSAVAGDHVQSSGWFFVFGPGGVAAFNASGTLGSDNVRFASVQVSGITGPLCIFDVVLADISGTSLPFTIGQCIPNSICDPTLAPTDIAAELAPSGSAVQLTWATTANSVGCRVSGRPLGAPGYANRVVAGFQKSSTTIPASFFVPGTTYEFYVLCSCTASPLTPTPNSELGFFTMPSPRLLEKSEKVVPADRSSIH